MRKLITSVAFLAVILVVATPAFAAEENGGGDAGKQLITPDFWTIVLTIIVFIVLVVVLSKTAWKPILSSLKEREETIAKALDDAKAANEAAIAKIAEYDAKLEQAKDEAHAIADEARKDGEDIRARIQRDAQADAAATVERAKREIEQLAAQAWEQVVGDAANIATEAASRIIQRDLSEQNHADIVSQVVADYAATKGGQA